MNVRDHSPLEAQFELCWAGCGGPLYDVGRQVVTTVRELELKWSLRNSDIVCERWFSGGDEVRIIAMDYKAELSVVVLDWVERKRY